MNNTATQPKTYIQCKDNEGILRKMSIPQWSEYTGKTYDAILNHWKRKKAEIIFISNRQVVGLDSYKWEPPTRKPKKADKSFEMLSEFNRRRLVC
ncbi:MAG: hypothetical protein ABFS32_22455 [Bacteroidota bacterium]